MCYICIVGKAVGKTCLDDVEIYCMKAVEGGEEPGTDPGEEDAIGTVKADRKVDAKVYTIGGQAVKKATKGLYIVNGKKFVVK